MSRIIEMLDTPNNQVLSRSERKHRFFKPHSDGTNFEPIMLKNSRGKLRKPNGKPIKLVIGEEDPDFTDFVEKCLEWDPAKRLTPDQALKHVWILKGLPPQVLIHH
jgi:dual specificity tyrosine-phosphorylation-regulated kinase 2/3/4